MAAGVYQKYGGLIGKKVNRRLKTAARAKPKTSTSTTKQHRKKKSKTSGNIRDPHFHTTRFFKSRKMSKGISLQLKIMRPVGQSINLSGSTSGGFGLQSAFIPRIEMTFDTLSPAFKMIPNVTNVNGGVPTGIINTSGGISILTQHSDLTYVNGTSALTFAVLYDVICTKDYTPNAVSGLITPLDFWEGGMLNTVNEGAKVTGNRENLGMTPNMSPLFRQYFRIEKTTNVHVGPGEIYTHKITIKHNRGITEDRMNKSIWYAGLTRFTMIKMHGQPVTATGTAITSVSTSPTKLDWVYSKKFTFTSMAKPDKQYNYYSGLPTITGTGEKIETDGDLATIKFT